MGILMGGVIRDAVSHGPLPFANACVTQTLHCYGTDGNGVWNNLADGGAYAYSGVSVTFSAGGHYSKTLNLNTVAYYPDLGINGLWEVVELDREPPPPPGCCFSPGTHVQMADGSTKRIEEVEIGEMVVGLGGTINRVTGVNRPALGGRQLYALDGGRPFVTAEHPFLTAVGWKSIDPRAAVAENAALRVGQLSVGDRLLKATSVNVAVAAGGVADVAYMDTTEHRLEHISAHDGHPTLRVYNLELDGDHTYIADGYVVHNKSSH